MKDRIARSVFWIVWSRGGIQLLSFMSTLLVARLLDPRDYGLMALAGIWTGTIALLAEMGMGAAIIQFAIFVQCRPAATATALMALTIVLVRSGWPRWGEDFVAVRLVLASLLAAAVYVTLLMWVGGPIRDEMKEALGWVFQRGRVEAAAR